MSFTDFVDKKEKKVEYIELVYDLIFVYMIGRNNSLLHITENGFVKPQALLAYIFCTLAIIQIWNFTTFYINMFGRNSIRDHIFLFVNMYLMYFIGQSVRTDFESYVAQYHIAWGLILINIGMQYLIELKNHKADVWNVDICRRMMLTLFVEAALVFAGGFVHITTGVVLSGAAIFTGIVLTMLSRYKSIGGQIDFAHLTERAMLYVVFTFGEMIIMLAVYFNNEGKWSWNTIYFSLLAFLIVVGLFLSYGYLYDHIIDREGSYDGMLYMIIHIFIIFAMNNITASLEFMREDEIDLLPKMLFLVISLVAFFAFLLLLKGYTKKKCRPTRTFLTESGAATAAFVVLMLVFREDMKVNILISVIYVFMIFIMLFATYKNADKQEKVCRQG
ncbi:MAG: low temperature requirement protein A [Lachnospiraceae bacterium]|nr:low temperature requirement protein A [Lachnospiraceae bacterium]